MKIMKIMKIFWGFFFEKSMAESRMTVVTR